MRLQRLLMIIFYLKLHKVATINELSQYLEVSTRTISRDMDMLRTAGVNIESKIGKDGGYSLSEDFTFDSILFSKSELNTMLLGTQFLHQFKNTEFAKDAEILYKKVSKIIEDDKDKEFILVDTENNTDYESKCNDVLKRIQEGHDSSKYLKIKYKSILCDKLSFLGFVAPYGLVNKSGYWYLVGYCSEQKIYRVFNILFIQDIYVSEKNFQKDKSFNLDLFWNSQNS